MTDKIPGPIPKKSGLIVSDTLFLKNQLDGLCFSAHDMLKK